MALPCFFRSLEAQTEFCSLIDKLCNTQGAGTWEGFPHPKLLKLLHAQSSHPSGDKYLVVHDFPSFVDAQSRVDATYADKAKWCKLSIQVRKYLCVFQ